MKSEKKGERRSKLKEILEENDYVFSRDFISRMASVIDNEKRDVIKEDVSLGLAQKIVNMAY